MGAVFLPALGSALVSVSMLVVFSAGCSPGENDDGGEADEGGPPVDGDAADAVGDRGAEGGFDADGTTDAVAGSLTYAVSTGTFLAERLCDFDGDGVGDNAIADLGSVMADLYVAYMSARAEAVGGTGRPELFHLPWVEDLRALTDGDVVTLYLKGEPPRELAEQADGVPPEGPYYTAARALDGCGEPVFHSESASLDAGVLVASGGTLSIFGIVVGRSPSLTVTLSPAGESAVLEGCAYATIKDGGAETFTFDGVETNALQMLIAGGRAVGVPTIPGLEPNVDLDGDGFERFLLDGEGRIEGCVDGDGTVIDGSDCWQDSRIADAFGLAFRLEGRRVGFVGREPGWERAAGGECPEGPPERSLFDSPAHDSVGCAAFEERCEPLAPQPCCDSDQVCSGLNGRDYRCFSTGCEAPLCDYGDDPGLCESHTEGLVCRPLWRIGAENLECEVGIGGCTTEYGVSDGTLCAQYPSGNRYCVETCASTGRGCDRTYRCMPQLFAGESLCVRIVPSE